MPHMLSLKMVFLFFSKIACNHFIIVSLSFSKGLTSEAAKFAHFISLSYWF